MPIGVGELPGAELDVAPELGMAVGVLLVVTIKFAVEIGEDVGVFEAVGDGVGVVEGGETDEGVPATPIEDITFPNGKENLLVVVLQHPG